MFHGVIENSFFLPCMDDNGFLPRQGTLDLCISLAEKVLPRLLPLRFRPSGPQPSAAPTTPVPLSVGAIEPAA